MNKKLIAAVAALFAGAIAVTGCSSDADVVSKNLSKESDQFKINRRVVFFNGITDKYLLSIEGKCSIKDENNQLEVTCKTGDDEYKKHFLGLSDNVSYFVEQLEAAEVSRYHYKVIFKPEVIIADVDRP
ncbi:MULTISPECIES: beta-sandwich lipoprotein [unclassified Nocardia]|uniref:beta-sandwich lipoprotein n=1 Tax=unclassified Nocardia TaxID=2637762 RepID=UPI00365C81B5